jgi:nitronate monooxygenase
MIQQALNSGDPERMQMWAGQSAKLTQAKPAAEITQQLWDGALALL